MQRLFIKSGVLCCLLISLFGQSAFNQKNCHFVFKETIKINNDALINSLKIEMLKENPEAGKSIDSTDDTKRLTIPEMVASVDSGLSDSNSYSLYEVFREGAFVVNQDLKKPAGNTIIKKANLLNCDFTVIDSFTFQKIDSVRVSFFPTGYKADKYSISKTGEHQIINGYTCEKIIINETSVVNNATETRYFEVWATRQIKPALPVYGVLHLSQKILSDFTPLAFKESNDQSMSMYSETIINDIRCPHRE